MSTGEMERLELSEDASSIAYGTASTTVSSESDDFFDEENVDSVGGLNREGRARSFHLRGALTHNVWTSMRFTTSFDQHGEEYQRVPTHLEDNVKLIVDPNLEAKERGTLYYAQESFYVNSEKPRYALTIAPDIYRRVFAEVADAKTIPCGLYFCCHGGDGAHTGVSHDDYVDISVAWVLVGIVFTFLTSVSLAPSTSYVDFSD